jgi:hypothetical protein
MSYYLPDNCPKKLRRVIKKHEGKRHPIARELDVNVYWVQRYIKDWKEPNNPETRRKMFLPTRKPRQPDHRPEHVNWWRHLKPRQRDTIIRTAYDQANRPNQ